MYSVAEANALVPAFEASFTELDRLRELYKGEVLKSAKTAQKKEGGNK